MGLGAEVCRDVIVGRTKKFRRFILVVRVVLFTYSWTFVSHTIISITIPIYLIGRRFLRNA
jgi:hypothetical protein